MAVTVTLECVIKQEKVAEFKETMSAALKDTRAFDGCRLVEFYENQDKPDSMMLYEVWDSKEHQQKYMAWRKDQGMFEILAEFLDSDIVTTYYNKLR